MAGAMRKMAVYLGLVEHDDQYDEYGDATDDTGYERARTEERTRPLQAVRDGDRPEDLPPARSPPHGRPHGRGVHEATRTTESPRFTRAPTTTRVPSGRRSARARRSS